MDSVGQLAGAPCQNPLRFRRAQPSDEGHIALEVRRADIADNANHSEPDLIRDRPHKLAGQRALIVDDLALSRKALAEQLRDSQMGVHQCASGPEALAALTAANTTEDGFDIALIDAQMPALDGFTLARTIRTRSELTRMQLVLLTPLNAPARAEDIRDAGFAGFVTKPVHQRELAHVLTAVQQTANAPDARLPLIAAHGSAPPLCATAARNRQVGTITAEPTHKPGYRERCLAAGMDDYITKPITIDELKRVMRRLLPPTQLPRNDPTATS